VHGVATSYRDERRWPMEVDADLVIRVLGLLEVHAGTGADRRRETAMLPAGGTKGRHRCPTVCST
jgi:4-alpha-glucanotransferase